MFRSPPPALVDQVSNGNPHWPDLGSQLIEGLCHVSASLSRSRSRFSRPLSFQPLSNRFDTVCTLGDSTIGGCDFDLALQVWIIEIDIDSDLRWLSSHYSTIAL